MALFVAEISGEPQKIWEKRGIKILIVGLVFPILLTVFHQVLLLPTILIGSVIVHFGGDPKLWGTVLSVIALVPAGWGAVATCKLIWPKL
jgi:hypothetical protein